MLATEASALDLRTLTLDDLADLYGQGDDDLCAAVLAECARRDRADRARQARQAVAAEWYDGAFAQYLAAEAETCGNLLSRAGLAAGIADPFGLWRGAESWARRMASEELCEFWDDHDGRLSLARYRRELAAVKRAARDERDLAAMDTEPEPEQPWQRVPGGAVRPVTVPVGSLTVAAWTAMDAAGTITLHPSRQRAEQWLSPAPEPAPPPAPKRDPAPASVLMPGPDVTPGALTRYTAALTALANHLDATTERVLANHARLTAAARR